MFRLRIHTAPKVVTPKISPPTPEEYRLMEERALIAEKIVESLKDAKVSDVTEMVIEKFTERLLDADALAAATEEAYRSANWTTPWEELDGKDRAGEIELFRIGVEKLLEKVCKDAQDEDLQEDSEDNQEAEEGKTEDPEDSEEQEGSEDLQE